MKRSWSDESLRLAAQTNNTMAGVLRALQLSTSPGNYKSVGLVVKRLGLDTTHFKGQAHGTSPRVTKIPLSELLVEGSQYGSNPLRKRLVKEGVLPNVCDECGNGPEWNGRTLVLQLDHKNGDSTDNRLENLRILCPNCHSQTSNFTGKSKTGRYRSDPKRCSCGAVVYRKSKRCKSCLGRHVESKTKWPLLDDLVKEVVQSSYTKVAAKLGVSDNAVKKYIKRRLGFAPRKHGLVHQEGVEPSRHEDGSI
jgi:hypothetical protein